MSDFDKDPRPAGFHQALIVNDRTFRKYFVHMAGRPLYGHGLSTWSAFTTSLWYHVRSPQTHDVPVDARVGLPGVTRTRSDPSRSLQEFIDVPSDGRWVAICEASVHVCDHAVLVHDVAG